MEITRPRPLPYLLRLEAAKQQMEPAEMLAAVIKTHPSFGDAAMELGVSRNTFLRWRKRLGIEVVTL